MRRASQRAKLDIKGKAGYMCMQYLLDLRKFLRMLLGKEYNGDSKKCGIPGKEH